MECIGVPGDFLDPCNSLDPCNTHYMGGYSWLPERCQELSPDRFVCRHCGAEMSLLYSGSVPVGDSKPDELQIFKVYICIEGSCWSRSRSCKVFRNCWRNIVPVANSHLDSTVPSLPLEGTKKQQHKDSAFGDVFGSGFTDLAFNSVNKEEEKEQTSDFSDLITALDSLNTHDPNIDPTVKQRKLSSEKRITEPPTQDAFDSTSLRILKQNSGGKILPSFEVNVAHASRSDRRLSRESHLDQHAQELANQFHEDAIHMQYDSVEPIQGLLEEDAQASSETSQRRVEASKHHTKVKPEALCGTTMLASWEGEAYEEDKVLVLTGRPAIKNSFLKFMKHISLNPEQCIRFNSCYSSVSVLNRAKSASVLWPESKVPCPKLCSYCKSPREFAFQIMGPSISALEETYEWSKYNVNNLEDMVIPPVSWDWISLAVFGCKIGCHGRDNTDHSSSWDTWLEEEIFVAQE